MSVGLLRAFVGLLSLSAIIFGLAIASAKKRRQADAGGEPYPHQPDKLDCECHDCQKNAIEQLSHQLDVERAASTPTSRLSEEQVRHLAEAIHAKGESADMRERKELVLFSA